MLGGVIMTEIDFNTTLAKNLVKFRKASGLTQAKLAELINYSGKSVSKWERGEGVPDIYTLTMISEIYGITVSELIGQKENKNNPKVKMSLAYNYAKEVARKKAQDHTSKQNQRKNKSVLIVTKGNKYAKTL